MSSGSTSTIRNLDILTANIPRYLLDMHIGLVVRLLLNAIMDDLINVVVRDFACVGSVALPAYDRLHDKIWRIGHLVRRRINHLPNYLTLIVEWIIHVNHCAMSRYRWHNKRIKLLLTTTITKFSHTVAILCPALLAFISLEIRVTCHAHVADALLSWLVLWDKLAPTDDLVLLNHVWANILPWIVWHGTRGNHSGCMLASTHLDLAFKDLVRWRDGLTTSAFKACERILTQLNLALLVRTFEKARVMLLNACTLHPLRNPKEEGGTLKLAAPLV